MHGYNYITLHTDLVHTVQIVDNCLWYIMEIEEKELDDKT
jgi:hypothetical protein